MNYTDDNRGKILYPERRQQIIDFSGLRYGNITPTDCDGIIEYRDQAWVFIEIKYRDTEFPVGQKLMHERLANGLEKAGKKTLIILAEHYVDDPKQTINAAECIVRQIYFKGEWLVPKGKHKLKDVVDRFIASVS